MFNSPIPVLQLIDGFATEEQSGGAAQFGIQLARHLDRQKYTPYVCGLWRYNTPSERRWREVLQQEGIGTAILIEEPTKLGVDMLRAAALLTQLLEQVKPRIVNSHFERGDLLGLWSKLAYAQRLRIARTMHADQQWQTRPWLGQLVNLFAFPWFFDAEVAISEATRQVMNGRISARLAGRQSVLLYNGIRSELVHNPPQRAARDNEAGKFRVAIIGRLEPQKGHRYFLEAAALLLQQVQNVEFWIIGTGSLLPEMQALATTLGIADAVQFWGQRNDIPEILASIDLVVSASIWEGFPTVILEAMAARVPVVATDVSGSRELVQSGITGLLVAPTAIEPLAQAMQIMLLDRRQSEQMVTNAWQRVQHHTIEATAEGYDQLYQEILQY